MPAPFVDSRCRTLTIGGVSKAQLLSRLEVAAVQLNEFARTLFADPRFTTLPRPSSIRIVTLTVAELGLVGGGTFDAILLSAAKAGLSACPLEVGPHLRLQDRDQPDAPSESLQSRNCAPPGSMTVISPPVAASEDDPQGFYLRRIDGVLWLRGYRSWAGHVWSPADTLVLAAAPLEAAEEQPHGRLPAGPA